jgi:ATP-binding cassette, subfamily B, bacterial
MADSSWALFSTLLRPHKRAVAVYATFLAVATSLPLSAAIVLQRFVDAATRSGPTSQLVALAAIYALIGLLSSMFTVAVVWRATRLAWQITDGLRHDLADQILQADLAFHRDHTRGDLVSRADDDVTAMAMFFAQFVARLVAIVVLAVAAIITLAILRPILAGPFAVCMVAVFSVLWFQRNGALAEALEEREAKGSLSSLIEERISGADDISSLGAGAHSVAQLADRNERLVQAAARRAAAQMRIVGRLKFSLVASEVVMLAWGGFLLSRDRLGIGAVVLGVRFASAIRGPVEQVAWRLQEVQGATGSATRVLQLRAARVEYVRRTQNLPVGPLAIALENVSLTYDDGTDAVLSRINVTVAAGTSLGLVGRSGSGKTTIGRLALRTINPTEGTVRFGGVDIQTIAEESFRERVTSIPQEVQLFPGTVRDNVAMFGTHTDAEIRGALHDVGLDSWLATQENELDTRLLARFGGAGLSAGEAQLLAFARALVRRPDIVVVDEATSRIDPMTQERIAEATVKLLRGRTSILIAHRLETLMVCDHIAVVEAGQIVEYGDRETLIANPDSRFATLLQAGLGPVESDVVESDVVESGPR